MKEIRKRLLELFRNNRVCEIIIDSEYRYISFETTNGAQYTFVPGRGNCIYSTKCSNSIIKIYGGMIEYYSDLPRLEDFYMEEYCIDCALKSLDDDMFNQYEDFGIE